MQLSASIRLPLSIAAALALLFVPARAQLFVPARAQLQPVSILLNGDGQDMAYDVQRGRLYVSVPSQNEIAVVSTATFDVLTTVFVGQSPHGIDISSDGTRLFTALRGQGAVSVLDLDTLLVVDTIDVQAELGDPLTYDVAEGKPDRVFVSANPSSSGFAWIAMIKIDQGNQVDRVADNRIIRCSPTFAKSPDQQSLYIGECFSPNSLYKLDITTDTAPIVLEDDHGSISGSNHLEVSPDGLRIYLRSGQVLGTSDFQQDGVIGPGPSRFAFDDTTSALIHVSEDTDRIEDYDTATLLKVGETAMPCPPPGGFTPGVVTFLALPNDMGFLQLIGDEICGEAVPGSAPPDVLGVVPNRVGYDDGPTPVTISGQFFFDDSVTGVSFGGTPATGVQIVDLGTITCTAPAGAPGPVDVVVQSSNGDGVLAEGFVYTPALLGPTTASPGDEVALEYLLDPGDALLGLWGVPAPPHAGPVFGGQQALDSPSHLFWLPLWPFDSFTLSTTLPNDPGLVGLILGLQALAGPNLGAGIGAWTNRVTLVVV